MWPPPTDKPLYHVTSDGRTIVDPQVLLSDPKLQRNIENLGKLLEGKVRIIRLPAKPAADDPTAR